MKLEWKKLALINRDLWTEAAYNTCKPMNQNLKASQEKSKQAMVCYYCNFSFVLNITAKNKLLNNQTLNRFFPLVEFYPMPWTAYSHGFPCWFSFHRQIYSLWQFCPMYYLVFFCPYWNVCSNLALIVKMSRK